MKSAAAPLVAGRALGPIVAALAGHDPKPPEWALTTLAELATALAVETLPREADPEIAAGVVALAAELVALAYIDDTRWRDPPEDGWPRGAGRRRRLGAIAEALTQAAALATPGVAALPPTLRRRALQLARSSVVLLARHDPKVGSRLLAPELARTVLERATSTARSAHEMGYGSQPATSSPRT